MGAALTETQLDPASLRQLQTLWQLPYKVCEMQVTEWLSLKGLKNESPSGS